MPNKPRYLIVTADERTWKFDRPVIFLGEWCRLYNRRHVWQDMDAIVATPYVLRIAKKDADYTEARALEEKLFPLLCDALNQYHGVQYGKRFWRIVIGHWLRRYVGVMLNRVKTLEQCLQTHHILGMTAYANDRTALSPLDSYSAMFAFNDDRWNIALTVRILDLLGEASFPVEFIEGCVSSSFVFEALETTPTLKKLILKWGYKQVIKLTNCLASDNDAFIIRSYLSKIEEIKLQLALGQFPNLWTSPKLEISEKPDRVLRESLASRVACKSGNMLDDILHLMIFELLPVCYLEGFAHLNKLVKQQSWPKNPKFIFTSNSFDTDEVFKLWAATKIESGSKYFTGQHGNSYGTHRYINSTIEEVSADKFLTWGWTDGLPQHTPAFVFKTTGRKTKHYNPQGGLLLIEMDGGNRLFPHEEATAEFKVYFEDQQNFIDKLQKPLRKQLTIRLSYSHTQTKWFEADMWRSFDRTIKLDYGACGIGKLIENSRLVIHSYDSTGTLETLSKNIPTLAFWQNEFDHLRDNAKPYYKLLVDAGIVHLNPETVAQKVNEVWDDVEGWWGQDKVQNTRKQFCNRYARVSQNRVQDLKKLLTANNL